MAENYLTPLADTRPAPGAGYGSYAIGPISAGTIVATFGGSLVGRSAFDQHDAERRSRSIQIEEDSYLLGPPRREPGDAVNHSCDPNCGMGGATQVVAMRDISVGEPLTFDYAMADGSDYDEFDCTCGSSLCRGRVSGTDWSRAELQTRYAGYFSPYLVRRMSAAKKARSLTKSDVEELMASVDVNPIESLRRAIGKALGRPHSSFETLVMLAPVDSTWRRGLLAADATALDRLASHLNELRGF